MCGQNDHCEKKRKVVKMNTGVDSRGGQTEHWDRNDSRGDFRVARAAPNLSVCLSLFVCVSVSARVLRGALLGVVQGALWCFAWYCASF